MTEQPKPLRQRVAAAIHRYDNHHALSGNDVPSKHHLGEADAVLTELKRELDALAEYENTINWMTTCTGCARVLDSCIRETERAERAEAALARIQAIADEHPAGIDTALIHAELPDRAGPATAQATEPAGVHRYLSTGCWHGDHAYCQSMTGLNGAKRPASCKFCQAACRCGCHDGEAEQPGPLTPAEEARLAQAGVHTPGCDCGHDGMGVSWHADGCLWRRGVVDCPGRELPGPPAHNDGPSVREAAAADRTWPLQKTGE